MRSAVVTASRAALTASSVVGMIDARPFALPRYPGQLGASVSLVGLGSVALGLTDVRPG
jgi:hypothetical protein